jgi:hypothetical protein
LAASEKLPSLMTSTKLCMVRKRSMARSISQPSATLSLTFALFSEQIRRSNVCFRRLRQLIRALVKRRIQGLLMYSGGLFNVKQRHRTASPSGTMAKGLCLEAELQTAV